MKHTWTTMIAVGALALSLHGAEVDQLKADLIGQSTGGREKCWKFQSLEQIKEIAIQNKTEDAQKRVYTVTLQLEASKACGRYAAEARIEYVKDGAGWRIKHVGLLSLTKIE